MRKKPKQSEESSLLESVKKFLGNMCNIGFIFTAIGFVLGLMPFTRPLFLDEKAPLKVNFYRVLMKRIDHSWLYE